jgi:hypothetical protein
VRNNCADGIGTLQTYDNMTLPESYRKIKPSIVAIARKYEILDKSCEKRSEAPFILGTGFFVDDGIVATNSHVSRIIDSQPKPPDAPTEEWPVLCFMFLEMNEHDFAMIPLKVLGKMEIESYKPTGAWYGPEKPDIAFLKVQARGLPCVKIQPDPTVLQEGMDLATAGFPLGRRTLTAPGYLHQLGPTLQKGILSAVLPYPRTLMHAFILNVISQGGASGSPVFIPETGDVVGILYAGLDDPSITFAKDVYTRPTAITYVLPASFIDLSLNYARTLTEFTLPSNTKTLQEIIDTYPRNVSTGPVRTDSGKALSESTISLINWF